MGKDLCSSRRKFIVVYLKKIEPYAYLIFFNNDIVHFSLLKKQIYLFIYNIFE